MSPIHDEERHRVRCTDAVQLLVDNLDMGWQKIVVGFDTSPEDATDRICCVTIADWEYRQAALRFNLRTVSATTDLDLYETVLHELVHVLVAPLWESLGDKDKERLHKLNELATENVSRALLHLMSQI